MPDDILTNVFADNESMINWFQTNVSFDFFTEGSADTQWSFFRDLGISITREDYRDIRRNILGLEFHQRDILALTDDSEIPDSFFYTRHGLELSGDYLYRFDVTMFDNRTGETIEGTRALISYDTPTVGELKSDMVDKLESGLGDSDITVLDIQLKGALIRG